MKIIKLAGTYILIGAAGAAGLALWTEILQPKCVQIYHRIKRRES